MSRLYVTPKAELRESRTGKGLFAKEKILAGEIVTDSNQGSIRYLTKQEASALPAKAKSYLFQVDDNKYYAIDPDTERETADFVNHACDPNCGIRGTLQIVAMRDIAPEEEITYDYAMNESDFAFTLLCQCGAPRCRHTVTGLDWYKPSLQKKYVGFFSDYLAKKMKRPVWVNGACFLRDHLFRFIKLAILNQPIMRKIRQRLFSKSS